MSSEHLLTTSQMARFVARGFLRFDELVPTEINEAATREMAAGITSPLPGTSLEDCYSGSPGVGAMLKLPQVQGIIQSLVGAGSRFDHHAVHVRKPNEDHSQRLHADSIIDIRTAFDIQLMYFPHDVTPDMGGTLLVPGSQFRRVNETDIGRYQNMKGQIAMACKAGTLLALHHGIWHCGRQNRTDHTRYMYKLRLNPMVPQKLLWNTEDLEAATANRQDPLFDWTNASEDNPIRILSTAEPWFEYATGRLEFVNRIKLWRHITGDDTFDIDYWLTRLENQT